MAQNEMRAMRGMPLRVRSMEGLGRPPSKTVHARDTRIAKSKDEQGAPILPMTPS
ncbi:hypothetical protein ANAEL_04986 [Anaerolineales bacterium]|nr:hypothetical protein ANAEL_04986 [Anaerolineales bacterium]